MRRRARWRRPHQRQPEYDAIVQEGMRVRAVQSYAATMEMRLAAVSYG
jgi:hypothetical protein